MLRQELARDGVGLSRRYWRRHLISLIVHLSDNTVRPVQVVVRVSTIY